METVTTKRGNPIAPNAIDGMVSQADHLNDRALRTRERGTFQVEATSLMPLCTPSLSRIRELARHKWKKPPALLDTFEVVLPAP
jgi:hypothetical protein